MFPISMNKKTKDLLLNQLFNSLPKLNELDKLDEILEETMESYLNGSFLEEDDFLEEYDSDVNTVNENVPDYLNEENANDLLENNHENLENNDENLENNDKKYNYDIQNYLNTDLSDNNNFKLSKFIYICAYNVNTESKHPFLQFLLVKDVFSNEIEFPYILIDKYNKINIQKEIELFLNVILLDIKAKNKYILNGIKEFNNELYVFVEIKDDDLKIDNKDTFLGLMDEITNSKHILDVKIKSKVSDFFLENPEFIFLKRENGNSYEMPVVVYQSLEEKLLNFTFMFGIRKSDALAIVGPYYYFTDYKNACDKFKHKNEKYGIIRSALFLGSMKVPMNFPEDEIDDSSIKKELLAEEEETNSSLKYNYLTMRISDHDGKWTKMYDSVYLGRTELDDGSFLKNTPIWVVKDYNQQFSLSYKIVGRKIKIW